MKRSRMEEDGATHSARLRQIPPAPVGVQDYPAAGGARTEKRIARQLRENKTKPEDAHIRIGTRTLSGWRAVAKEVRLIKRDMLSQTARLCP